MTNGTMLSTNCMSETFRELRPLCVEIAREPTHSKIDGLHEYLQSHKFNNNFAAMLDYIIFPLHTTIRRRNTSLDLKLKAIKCICVLLSQTKISSFDLFQKIFQNVCLMLSSKEPGKVREMTEDDKEALVDCILTLLDSSPHVLEGMYGNEYMPSTGHCITLLLHIAENDKAKHLRVKAIKCIEKLVFVSEEKEKNMGEQLCKQEKLLSMKLASFLPGISISLVKIVSGGMNQGQNVIIGALDAWLVHIQVVMNDKYLPVRSSTNSADNIVQLLSNLTPYKQNRESAKVSQKQTSGEKCLEVQKDKEWFSNTSSNLRLLIDRVITLGRHPIWKVRMALLRFCEVLLKNCYKSLQKCVPSLLETVLGFFSDEYSQISRRSKMVMDDLNMLLTNDGKYSIF